MAKIVFNLYLIGLIGLISACKETPRQEPVREKLAISEASKKQLIKHSVGISYKGNFYCSGVIVSEDTILTAGHCFVNFKMDNINKLRIGFGENQRKPTEERMVKEIIRPEVFRNKAHGALPFWDVSLVKLETTIPEGYEKAPFYSKSPKSLETLNGRISSFGANSENLNDFGNLKNSEAIVSNYFSKGIHEGLMNLKFHSNGACHGDSGGGFFIQEAGQWKLAGIVSGFLDSITNQVDQNFEDIYLNKMSICEFNEAVFTPVGVYGDWLNQYLEEKISSFPILVDSNLPDLSNVKNWCEELNLSQEEKSLFLDYVLNFREKVCIKDSAVIEDTEFIIDSVVLKRAEILSLMNFASEVKVYNSILRANRDIDGLYNLRRIEISESELSNISTEKFYSLESLSVLDSKFDLMFFTNIFENKKLKELFVMGVDMEPHELRLPASLRHLSITRTNLKDSPDLSSSPKLEIVNLSNNQLQEGPDIEALKGLKLLDLSFNQIEDLGFLRHISPETELILTGNPVDYQTCPREISVELEDLCAKLEF